MAGAATFYPFMDAGFVITVEGGKQLAAIIWAVLRTMGHLRHL